MTEQIVPDEVRRLRLEPNDRLVVRIADPDWTPGQLHQYQEHLQSHFTDNEVLVIVGDEIAVERAAPEPQPVSMNVSGNTSEQDVARLAEKIGNQIARALSPGAGVRMFPREDRTAAAETAAAYIQRAVVTPEEIRKVRQPESSEHDNPDDGLAGVPARR